MKLTLVAASLALVAATTAGCGGGGAPTDASEKDFCANYQAMNDTITGLGKDAKDSDVVKALKEAGDKFDETGTPKGISDDARKGFELTVKVIEDLPDDATEEDLNKVGDDLSATEKKQQTAFTDYLSKTCGS